MSENIQSTNTGQTLPCFQQKIDKSRYLVEIHFSDTSSQSVEDKLSVLYSMIYSMENSVDKEKVMDMKTGDLHLFLVGLMMIMKMIELM